MTEYGGSGESCKSCLKPKLSASNFDERPFSCDIVAEIPADIAEILSPVRSGNTRGYCLKIIKI